LGSLAQLCRLLDFERRLLRLGAPVLGLGARALAIGTVIDVLESPQVRGFVAAAGWLPPGVFRCDMASAEPCQVQVVLESSVEGYPAPMQGWRSFGSLLRSGHFRHVVD
jgi:hypothetical protein